MKKICDFIAKWLGVLVLVAAIAALAFPASFVWIDTWVINPVLGLIMFGMGLTLSPKDFKVVLGHFPWLSGTVHRDAASGISA